MVSLPMLLGKHADWTLPYLQAEGFVEPDLLACAAADEIEFFTDIVTPFVEGVEIEGVVYKSIHPPFLTRAVLIKAFKDSGSLRRKRLCDVSLCPSGGLIPTCAHHDDQALDFNSESGEFLHQDFRSLELCQPETALEVSIAALDVSLQHAKTTCIAAEDTSKSNIPSSSTLVDSSIKRCATTLTCENDAEVVASYRLERTCEPLQHPQDQCVIDPQQIPRLLGAERLDGEERSCCTNGNNQPIQHSILAAMPDPVAEQRRVRNHHEVISHDPLSLKSVKLVTLFIMCGMAIWLPRRIARQSAS